LPAQLTPRYLSRRFPQARVTVGVKKSRPVLLERLRASVVDVAILARRCHSRAQSNISAVEEDLFAALPKET